MKKIVITAILYSKKNYDLSYKLHTLCKKNSANLILAQDFVELTIKSLELKPQVIFCDCKTIEFTSGNLNCFLEKNEFRNTKIIFIGQDKEILPFSNIVCQNISIANVNSMQSIFDDLHSNLNYELLLEKVFLNYDGLELDVFKLLANIGLSPKHSGYAFLGYAIKSVVLNNGVMDSLTTEQYPKIAYVFKTSPSNVERNIRNAIFQAWKTFGKNNWGNIFFLKTLEMGKRPTNREFIYMCSEIILSQNRVRLAGKAI